MKKFNTLLSSISVKVLMALVLFIASLFIFSFLVHEAVLENEDIFDTKTFLFFKQYSSPGLISLMRVLTFFGSSLFLLPAYIILVGIYLIKKRKNDAIDIAIIGISSTLLMFGLKFFFQRQRPDLPLFMAKGYSFPSGHALSSFIFCSILIFLIWKSNWNKVLKWSLAALLILFSLGIGISRIVLRLHYPSDVLAGFSLGYVWAALSFWILQKIRVKNKAGL